MPSMRWRCRRWFALTLVFTLSLAFITIAPPATATPSAASVTPLGSTSGWLETGPLPGSIYLPYAVVTLHDGRVLAVASGAQPGQQAARASIYDQATNAWTQTSQMNLASGYGAPVVLDDGNVLFTGGGLQADEDPDTFMTLSACQIYDPATNQWSSVAPMLESHAEHTATLLADGSVLVVGGVTGRGESASISGATNDVERYNPTTNTWTRVGSEKTPRISRSVVLLRDGRVMVVSGNDGRAHYLSSAELFDPKTDSWSLTAPMNDAHDGASATVLLDGDVLLAGGADDPSTALPLLSSEIYDPTTNSWSNGPRMATPRKDQAAVLLPSGKVLVVGGNGVNHLNNNGIGVTNTSELYDPATNSWSNGPDLPEAVGYPSAVPLADGNIQALVLGATNLNGAASRGLLYTSRVPGPTQPQLAPGGPLPANRVYFPQTGHYLADGFLAYWQHFGGLPVFGYPISEEFQQSGITVQYFERARFEWHPGSDPARYDVELGLLGDQAAQAQGLLTTAPFQPIEAASDQNCTFDTVTDHRLCFGFRAYWQSHGGLLIFGRPISEEFSDPTSGLTVQYFERAVFEYHPEKPAPYQVLLRRLGAEQLAGE